ncbi:hypothetical protein ACFL5O_07970 [Myxococcota bacterium]
MATVWGGALAPEPGFKPIVDLSHTAPVVGLAGQLGGGAEDFALSAELLYERLLTRLRAPSTVGFDLFGIGIAASMYSDEDWLVTAHLRWILMLLWKSDIPCWHDRGDGTSGPGIGVTLGKEWHPQADGGIGVALQGNYAALSGNPELNYLSGLLLLTLTRF